MKDETRFYFDNQNRFVIQDFTTHPPFASFLPGISGSQGIPMWVFYTNRGQGIAGFGIENRDNPIAEFYPANKAYQTTAFTGFRTFIKVLGKTTVLYEPFAPWEVTTQTRMAIGMNELELQAISRSHNLETTVVYFTLSNEPFAGLVRQVQITNSGDTPLALEILDGLPLVQPFGVDEYSLKMMGRTLEAWKGVLNVESTPQGLMGVPFYRFSASASDTAEVTAIHAGHFYLAFIEDNGTAQVLTPLVDPDIVFGTETSLHTPEGFLAKPLAELQTCNQVTTSKTPCGFFGTTTILAPGASCSIHAIIGHMGNTSHVQQHQARLTSPTYLKEQRTYAQTLAQELSDAIATHTADQRFDAYCRQTFIDNVLRGGWPLLLGDKDHPIVYHIYSRKHGDMERDYNAFYLAAEMYSQGNGNYRDVAQNRRCDVFFEPRIDDFNILSFLSLIQADGYNPLVVLGNRFTLATEHHAAILALVKHPEVLTAELNTPFTPGSLLRVIYDQNLGLKVSPAEFVSVVLSHTVTHFEASFGEGYWTDHWFYNLDLIETYLALYPDRKSTLLFEKYIPYFDNYAFVQPRHHKYVLTGENQVRQYGAVVEDEEKAALIATRAKEPNLARTNDGQGEIYYTTVFAKLTGLALLKFAALDPLGMGVQMEAGKPGWYDAINGLPGLFGASLCETYELARLLDFLVAAMAEKGQGTVALPVEQHSLLQEVEHSLAVWSTSNDPNRDFQYWDRVTAALEIYRERVQRGFAGANVILTFDELTPLLVAFRTKVQTGIERAVASNAGIPPTYITYTVTEYAVRDETDSQGRPYITAKHFEPHMLPLFLEGPVHALKITTDTEAAQAIHTRIKASQLYDRKLGMYKVNAPLENETHELGRCRAFTPGWLENESIWLHMEYKYLLELLKAGLFDDFFADFKQVLIPFQDPEIYGRSPLENSSFIVSSAHLDTRLHGRGFIARLSGSTAEFLDIWRIIMAGKQPFYMQQGALQLRLEPTLPGWLFDAQDKISFTFLGQCTVVYHNPERKATFGNDCVTPHRITLETAQGDTIEITTPVNNIAIAPPYAAMVRDGDIKRIDVLLKGSPDKN